MRDRIHLNKQNVHLHQLIRMIDVAFNENKEWVSHPSDAKAIYFPKTFRRYIARK